MYHYEYAAKPLTSPVVNEFIEITNEVQDLLREEFTFSFDFIGSHARNMITYDPRTNKGFDIDMNFHINKNGYDNFEPAEIKHKIIDAFKKVYQSRERVPIKTYTIEDSTRVITIKKKTNDLYNPTIVYSCDIALVRDIKESKKKKRQEYIRFNKESNQYVWEIQPNGYGLEKEIKLIKSKNLWNEVRELYLDKKNNNTNPDKKSRSLYAETIHEIYDLYSSKHRN